MFSVFQQKRSPRYTVNWLKKQGSEQCVWYAIFLIKKTIKKYLLLSA